MKGIEGCIRYATLDKEHHDGINAFRNSLHDNETENYLTCMMGRQQVMQLVKGSRWPN